MLHSAGLKWGLGRWMDSPFSNHSPGSFLGETRQGGGSESEEEVAEVGRAGRRRGLQDMGKHLCLKP